MSNFYFFWQENNLSRFSIYRRTGGADIELGSYATTAANNVWYLMRFTTANTTVAAVNYKVLTGYLTTDTSAPVSIIGPITTSTYYPTGYPGVAVFQNAGPGGPAYLDWAASNLSMTVANMTAQSGSWAGGDTVQAVGTQLGEEMIWDFGGATATSMTFTSGVQYQMVTPTAPAGRIGQTVTVTGRFGTAPWQFSATTP